MLHLAGALGVVVAMMLTATPAAAQATAGTAEIGGTVYDTESKPLPGATVFLQNIDTGYKRSLVSDAQGHWSAPTMPVGNYQLDVSLSGLVPVRVSKLALSVGMTITRDVTLTMGTVTETIVVSGQAETSRNSCSSAHRYCRSLTASDS
ncbi:MAG: hypothetical protein DMF59_01300 [Acidobacteria bacterium]|nr:MAG: hypothetical protein DMF59_01300 [Acidobacteriota bacterium]